MKLKTPSPAQKHILARLLDSRTSRATLADSCNLIAAALSQSAFLACCRSDAAIPHAIKAGDRSKPTGTDDASAVRMVLSTVHHWCLALECVVGAIDLPDEDDEDIDFHPWGDADPMIRRAEGDPHA